MSKPYNKKKTAGQGRSCPAVIVFLLLIAAVLLSLNPALSPAYAQSSEIEYLRNQAEIMRANAEEMRAYAEKRRNHAKQYRDNAEEARRRAEKSKRKIDKDSYLDDARRYDERAEAAALDADKAEAQATQAEDELAQLLKTLERSSAKEPPDTPPSKPTAKEVKPKYPAVPQKQTVPVQTEKFPPHMINMAAQLYKGMGDELEGEHLTPERRKVLEKSVKTLREMKIDNWSARPVKVKNGSAGIAEKLGLDQKKLVDRVLLKNFMETKGREGTAAALKNFTVKTKRRLSDEEANKLATEIDGAYGKAFEALGKNYRVTTDDGRTVQMKWYPDAGKFFMKVFDDGKSDGEEFASNFSGDVKTSLTDNGRDITLDTTPAKNPLQVITAADIEMMRANILGEWPAENGDIYKFSAAEEKVGEVRPPRKFFDEQIEQAKDKVKSIKDTKVHKWGIRDKNKIVRSDTIVRQEKFQKLKEPLEYLGEEYTLEDAEEKIVALETKITELEAECDGETLLPVQRFDPSGYKEMKASEGARTITVHVTRPSGYSYSYDEAAFDGRRITARRTLKTVEDTNEKLPAIIREKLIRDGWKPWGSLELEASVDVETGDLILEGLVWSGNVTYSTFFGSPGEISSIHTPYSRALRLEGFKLISITITDETFRNELQKVMPGVRFWVSAKGSGGNSDIVDRVRVSVYPEEAEESEWIEVELVETGPDTLEFHSSPEGILVVAEEEEEGPEIIEPEPPVEVAGEEDEEGEGPPSVCSCGGGACECVLRDECGVLFLTNAVSDWRDKYMETDGPEAAATWKDTLRDREKSLNEAERKCNKPGAGGTGVATAEPPQEDTPGCSCSAVGNNCVCPEAFACGGANHVVQEGEGGVVLSAEWVCGGASGGGGGVSVATAPPEDTNACRCGGDACTCLEEDACGVQNLRDQGAYWARRALLSAQGNAGGGPMGGASIRELDLLLFQKALFELKRKCNTPRPMPNWMSSSLSNWRAFYESGLRDVYKLSWHAFIGEPEPGGEPESGGESGGDTGVATAEPPPGTAPETGGESGPGGESNLTFEELMDMADTMKSAGEVSDWGKWYMQGMRSHPQDILSAARYEHEGRMRAGEPEPGDEPGSCSCGGAGCKCADKYDCGVPFFRDHARYYSNLPPNHPMAEANAGQLEWLLESIKEAEKKCK